MKGRPRMSWQVFSQRKAPSPCCPVRSIYQCCLGTKHYSTCLTCISSIGLITTLLIHFTDHGTEAQQWQLSMVTQWLRREASVKPTAWLFSLDPDSNSSPCACPCPVAVPQGTSELWWRRHALSLGDSWVTFLVFFAVGIGYHSALPVLGFSSISMKKVNPGPGVAIIWTQRSSSNMYLILMTVLILQLRISKPRAG